MKEEHDKDDLIESVEVPSVGAFSDPHILVPLGEEVDEVDGVALEDPHLLSVASVVVAVLDLHHFLVPLHLCCVLFTFSK